MILWIESTSSVRKQIKIRPGFTPQEDISRFRGSKQAQMDSNALPKGHIVGWTPPPTTSPSSASTTPKSKSAKKNEKRKEKRKEKAVVVEKIKDNWDDDDEDDVVSSPGKGKSDADKKGAEDKAVSDSKTAQEADKSSVDGLSDELKKLEVR